MVKLRDVALIGSALAGVGLLAYLVKARVPPKEEVVIEQTSNVTMNTLGWGQSFIPRNFTNISKITPFLRFGGWGVPTAGQIKVELRDFETKALLATSKTIVFTEDKVGDFWTDFIFDIPVPVTIDKKYYYLPVGELTSGMVGLWGSIYPSDPYPDGEPVPPEKKLIDFCFKIWTIR